MISVKMKASSTQSWHELGQTSGSKEVLKIRMQKKSFEVRKVDDS